MSSASDFVIENGVLTEYKGPGGDVVIPEGVTSIGPVNNREEYIYGRITAALPAGAGRGHHRQFSGTAGGSVRRTEPV